MERESELVKVTGGMSLCSERGGLQGMLGWAGLGWLEDARGAAPRSTSAFPRNIPAPGPCQHGGERWLSAPAAARGCWWSISRSTGWNRAVHTAEKVMIALAR